MKKSPRRTSGLAPLLTSLAFAVTLAACGDRAGQPTPAPSAAPSPPAVSSPTSSSAAPHPWLGRWTGPEGTFLTLASGPDGYDITIQNLDGPRRFKGHAEGDVIRFERDGVQETLRAGNGDATGMKWLAGKSHCLVLRVGEGYCRE